MELNDAMENGMDQQTYAVAAECVTGAAYMYSVSSTSVPLVDYQGCYPTAQAL